MLMKKIAKSGIVLACGALLTTTLSPAAVSYASAQEQPSTSVSTENAESSDTKIIKVSNQEIFDAMKANGYNIEDYLTEKEINQAKEENDQLTIEVAHPNVDELNSGNNSDVISIQAGHTGFTSVNDNTFNLHLNSTLTTLLIGTGAGAVTGALMTIPAVAAALSGVGIKSGALVGFLGTATGLIAGEASNGISITGRTYMRNTFLGPQISVRVTGVYLQ